MYNLRNERNYACVGVGQNTNEPKLKTKTERSSERKSEGDLVRYNEEIDDAKSELCVCCSLKISLSQEIIGELYCMG